MNKSKKKKQVFHAMMEFEKKYFPRSFEKKMAEKPTNAHDLGIWLAKESVDKIRSRLAE